MRRSVLLLSLLLAASAASAELKRFKGWDESPQAYFMTKAERARWRSVHNDEDADAFVSTFLARRGGPSFATDVQQRVAAADQYYMRYNIKGTPTLRRLIVIFGLPSAVRVSRPMGRNRLTPAPPPEAVTNLTPGSELNTGGHSMRPMQNTGSAGECYRNCNITFAHTPGFEREFVVTLEVNESNGKDALARSSKRQDLEDRIEAAALASITKP
jgi:hypothetical protein